MGNEEWRQVYGGTGFDDGRSLQQTSDGGFIIGGITNSFDNGEYDMYLIKTDSLGSVTSVGDPSFNAQGKSLLKIVDVLGRETVPKANTPLFYIYENGRVEKRLIIE